MIAEFVDKLSRLGIELTAREIADVLFLALQITPSADETPARELISDRSPEKNLQSPPPDVHARASGVACEPKTGELYVPLPKAVRGGMGAGMGAVSFRSASAVALPGAARIAKALRPLMRRYPSRTRHELDVERTVEASANTGVSLIENRPVPERWLEAALIVDEGSSMRVWGPTIRGVRRLLERHGAFRDVRVWGMNADDGTPRLYNEIGRVAPPLKPGASRGLCGPEGRHLIIVLSDCISTGWRNGEAFKLLADWGRKAPTLLIQMLPQRLWPMTALPRIDARLSAPAPGLANVQLLNRGRGERKTVATPMPLAILEGWAMAPWAQMVAGRGRNQVSGFLIPSPWPQWPPAPDSDEAEALREEENQAAEFKKKPVAEQARIRVEEFDKSASRAAFDLARYLTAVELSLPVMRLVQQAMIPNSRQSHLAEALLSGLIYQRATPSATTTGAEQILYDFHPGVRELLREEYIASCDLLRVVSEVSRLVENRLPLASDFRAMLTQLEQKGEQQIVSGRRPFAYLHPDTLRSLGFAADAEETGENGGADPTPSMSKAASKAAASGVESRVALSEPKAKQKIQQDDEGPGLVLKDARADVPVFTRLAQRRQSVPTDLPQSPPPIGKRQSSLVIGPANSGKTFLLLAIGQACFLRDDEKIRLRFMPGSSDPDHAPSDDDPVKRVSASELIKKSAEIIAGEYQGKSSEEMTDYSFELDVDGEIHSPWGLLGRKRYISSALEMTFSDGPGGVLFPDEADKNVPEETFRRWQPHLIARTHKALSIALCVDAARPKLSLLHKGLPELIKKMVVETREWQTESHEQGVFDRLRGKQPPMRQVIRHRLNGDRFLLLLNKIDILCAEHGGRPDQIAARIEPVETAKKLLGVELLNQIQLALKPDAQFAVGVTSALGFHSTDGMPLADENGFVPKDDEALRTWRPFGVRDALIFIATGRAAGSVRLIKAEDLQ